MRGVGGATGRGADVDHVRELSLGSLVGSCGRVLEATYPSDAAGTELRCASIEQLSAKFQ